MDAFKGNVIVVDDVLLLEPFVPTLKKEWRWKEGVDDRYKVVHEEPSAQALKRVSVGAIAAKQLPSKKLLREAIEALKEGHAFMLGANVAEALYEAPNKWPKAWKVDGFKIAFPATLIEGHYTTEQLIALVWWNTYHDRPEFGYISLCDRTLATSAYIAVLEGNALV